MTGSRVRVFTAVALALLFVGSAGLSSWRVLEAGRTHLVAYFDNSNGLYVGDEVRILGVPVGKIERIEPQPTRVKVEFWVDRRQRIPVEVQAMIVSPQLVTARAIQLTPPYTGGATMDNGGVIPQDRTAVPLEWDDLRDQLEKLSAALQPTEPGGVSTLGAFVNMSAQNLRDRGAEIRDTLVNLSAAMSILGDHSEDIFSTVNNLSVVVTALEGSSTLMQELNGNLAAVTELLAGTPEAIGTALEDVNDVVGQTTRFIADNREAMGTATDRLASISEAVHESLDDVEQALHLFPNTLQNFMNIYQPVQQGLTGALTMQNFANPISFLCGAIQAASRLNSEQSAKLCVQYLAPIVKNRQYNFFPLGANYFVGASARPNEITHSEDWLRPEHAPGPIDSANRPTLGSGRVATDPSTGMPGLMLPPEGKR